MVGVKFTINIPFDNDDMIERLWDKAQDISNLYTSAIVSEEYSHGNFIVSFESRNYNEIYYAENDTENMFFEFSSYLNKKLLKYEVQYYEGS